jgi:hypothetical protein
MFRNFLIFIELIQLIQLRKDVRDGLLKDKILNEGKVRSASILKVDDFLNHQIDVELMNEIGKE